MPCHIPPIPQMIYMMCIFSANLLPVSACHLPLFPIWMRWRQLKVKAAIANGRWTTPNWSLQFSGMTGFSNYLFNRKLVGKSLKGKTASAGPRYASSNCQDCKLNLADICACVRSSILPTCFYVSVSLLQICKSDFSIKLKLPRIELLTTMKKTNLTIFNFFYGSQPQPFQPF